MILIKESFKLSYSNLKTFYGYVLTCWMKFKVIERVISPVAVFVMNDFPRFQGAAKCFRHNKTVLINLSSFICHRILRYIDLAIAMTGKFSMEWLCPVLDLPGKLYGAMATTTSINLGVSSSSLNVFHGNPPILKATTTCNQNSESVLSLMRSSPSALNFLTVRSLILDITITI